MWLYLYSVQVIFYSNMFPISNIIIQYKNEKNDYDDIHYPEFYGIFFLSG